MVGESGGWGAGRRGPRGGEGSQHRMRGATPVLGPSAFDTDLAGAARPGRGWRAILGFASHVPLEILCPPNLRRAGSNGSTTRPTIFGLRQLFDPPGGGLVGH